MSYKTNKFEVSAPTRNGKYLNYLIDGILYQIFKIVLSISVKSMEETLLILK